MSTKENKRLRGDGHDTRPVAICYLLTLLPNIQPTSIPVSGSNKHRVDRERHASCRLRRLCCQPASGHVYYGVEAS